MDHSPAARQTRHQVKQPDKHKCAFAIVFCVVFALLWVGEWISPDICPAVGILAHCPLLPASGPLLVWENNFFNPLHPAHTPSPGSLAPGSHSLAPAPCLALCLQPEGSSYGHPSPLHRQANTFTEARNNNLGALQPCPEVPPTDTPAPNKFLLRTPQSPTSSSDGHPSRSRDDYGKCRNDGR